MSCIAISFDSKTRPLYTAALARTENEHHQCYQLRHQELYEEAGLTHSIHKSPLGKDQYDDYCQQLFVRNNVDGTVVATARLLRGTTASALGKYSFEDKFDIENVLALPGEKMEIGKTCIHADYRNLLVVDTLWLGLASLIVMHNIDYVFGSVTIPTTDAGRYAQAVMKFVRAHHFAKDAWRVNPKVPAPHTRLPSTIDVVLPSVLKTYFRIGAVVCGDAYWDTANQVAELFFLLDRSAINARFTGPLTEHVSSLTAG